MSVPTLCQLVPGSCRSVAISSPRGAAADEQVERGSDRLYEEAEPPQALPAAHLGGRTADEVPQRHRGHDELGSATDDDRAPRDRPQLRPPLLPLPRHRFHGTGRAQCGIAPPPFAFLSGATGQAGGVELPTPRRGRTRSRSPAVPGRRWCLAEARHPAWRPPHPAPGPNRGRAGQLPGPSSRVEPRVRPGCSGSRRRHRGREFPGLPASVRYAASASTSPSVS